MSSKLHALQTALQKDQSKIPWFDVAALLHKSSQWEPQTVENCKVVGDWRAISVILNMPLERTETTHQKQHDTDTNVGKYDTHPNLVRQRIHEWKHTRSILDRFLQHQTAVQNFRTKRRIWCNGNCIVKVSSQRPCLPLEYNFFHPSARFAGKLHQCSPSVCPYTMVSC